MDNILSCFFDQSTAISYPTHKLFCGESPNRTLLYGYTMHSTRFLIGGRVRIPNLTPYLSRKDLVVANRAKLGWLDNIHFYPMFYHIYFYPIFYRVLIYNRRFLHGPGLRYYL